MSKTVTYLVAAGLAGVVMTSTLARQPGEPGPVVPGVKGCTVPADGAGSVIVITTCPNDTICCTAPVYSGCDPGVPGPCLIALTWTCCPPTEDCWMQRQPGGTFSVWCGSAGGIEP